MNNKVGIIIVNWNGLRFLEDCLKSIYNQTYKDFKVIFVDNGSVDESIKFVEKEFPQTEIIKLSENTGFAKGNNIGINGALKDKEIKYIALLNNDTIVDKIWLEELIRTCEMYENEKAGMISSKTLLPNNTIHNIGLALYKDLCGPKYGGCSIGFGLDPNYFKTYKEVFCPGGVSALFKRELLEEVGLFDEDFFAYAEDLDLGFRARLAGWRCYYAPKSILIHLHSQTGGAASPFKAFYSKRNSYFVAIKNFNSIDLLLYPFRDIYWNLQNLLNKDKIKSFNKLNSKIGFKGLVIIMIKVYWEVIINLPNMLMKRWKNNKLRRLSKKDYNKLFNI